MTAERVIDRTSARVTHRVVAVTAQVLSSRGLGGFTGLLVGSVAVAVAAHGHCLLVVVRGPELGSPPPTDGPIVVGRTEAAHDTATLRFAFETADRCAAPLTAVHTWGDVPFDATPGKWSRLTNWEAVHQSRAAAPLPVPDRRCA